MIATLYSSDVGFDTILDIIKSKLPKAKINISNVDDFHVILASSGGGLFSGKKNEVKVSYRQRKNFDVPFHESGDCPLSQNLNGLYGYISKFPSQNPKIRELLMMKVQTLKCEFSVIQETGETSNLKEIIESLAQQFDTIIFAQANTMISKSGAQHFLNKDLQLVLDTGGNSAVDNLGPEIEQQYQERERQYTENVLNKLTQDQRERKLNNEELIRNMGVKVNRFLPATESDQATKIRTPKEIANRVTVMSFINFFAMDHMPADKVIESLKEKQLWEHVTPKEIDLLTNPTDEKKNNETWKCEGIWTLLWALNIIDDLKAPNALCHLGDVPQERYPVHDATGFVNSIESSRFKEEILDATDLYYRLDWACVDARVKGMQVANLHQGVVYERHYALNWLINYGDQDWDDVSCDT